MSKIIAVDCRDMGMSLVADKLARIEKEQKQVGIGDSTSLTITCYIGYDEQGNVVKEINEGFDVCVEYETHKEFTPTHETSEEELRLLHKQKVQDTHIIEVYTVYDFPPPLFSNKEHLLDIVNVITLDIEEVIQALKRIEPEPSRWYQYVNYDFVCINCGRLLMFDRELILGYNFCECCGRPLNVEKLSNLCLKGIKDILYHLKDMPIQGSKPMR